MIPYGYVLSCGEDIGAKTIRMVFAPLFLSLLFMPDHMADDAHISRER